MCSYTAPEVWCGLVQSISLGYCLLMVVEAGMGPSLRRLGLSRSRDRLETYPLSCLDAQPKRLDLVSVSRADVSVSTL